jgi:hypothetical protein
LTQHFHPDFGYFHPVARFRRDLRVAVTAFASGAALGAVAILAVHVSYSEPENASALSMSNQLPARADASPAVVPETPTPEQRRQQRQARSSTAENTAVIARLPLDRPDAVDLANLPSRAETSAVSQSVDAPHIPHVAEAPVDLRTGEVARSRSDRPLARQEKSSRNLIGARDLMHKERSIGTAASRAQWEETAPREAATGYARGRTVFWDWSR